MNVNGLWAVQPSSVAKWGAGAHGPMPQERGNGKKGDRVERWT